MEYLWDEPLFIQIDKLAEIIIKIHDKIKKTADLKTVMIYIDGSEIENKVSITYYQGSQ